MKRIITIAIAITMLISCSALSGCGEDFLYENADRYVAGNQEYPADIKKIEIDWTSGNVNIISYDGDKILLEEENSSDKEEYQMYSLCENGELKVKYCKSGSLISGAKKSLTVSIPSSVSLDELELDVTSAEVAVVDVSTGKFDFESTSGTSNIAINASEVDVDTTSGDLTLATNAKKIEIDSTSGEKNLIVPADTGFTAEIKINSGDFNSSLPLVNKGNTYTYLDGGTSIKIESTSGDVSIETAVE